MPTVAVNNEVATVIIIFTVAPVTSEGRFGNLPQQQQELIEAIADFLDTVKQQPGFVSASIHKSIDGVKVANYAQWQSQKDFENFINNEQVQAKATKLREFNPPDSHIYEIAVRPV